MKIMLDTNILISTALFPRGAAARAFKKSLMPPFEPVVCDYIIDELRRKFREKFSNRTASLETFMDRVLPHIGIVPTPRQRRLEEQNIRDVKDRPILRAAINAHVDFLLTGDKDFLEASVPGLKMISVSEFLSMK